MLANLGLFVLALIIVMVVLKVLGKSMKTIISILINALAGAMVLWVLSIFWPAIQINIVSSLIVGVLGVPGVILVVLLQLVF